VVITLLSQKGFALYRNNVYYVFKLEHISSELNHKR